MCRLFAYSGPARDLSEFLVGPSSLQSLACDHPDGWGIATWKDGAASVRKAARRADADASGFAEAVEATRSTLVLAHIRKASVGGRADVNTHPFVHDQWGFAHNGTLRGMTEDDRARELKALPEEVTGFIAGDTDSEFVFAAFLERLRQSGVTEAPDVSVELKTLTRALIAKYPGDAEKRSKATTLAGNGEFIVGSRTHRELSALQGDGFAVLASQPLGETDGWRQVPEGARVVLRDGRFEFFRDV